MLKALGPHWDTKWTGRDSDPTGYRDNYSFGAYTGLVQRARLVPPLDHSGSILPLKRIMPIDLQQEQYALDLVEAAIFRMCRSNRQTPHQLFGKVVRQAIDEVVDGPRTGRWSLSQLEKTEKTYIGTKIEVLTRVALGLERSKPLDIRIEGYPVDIKWSERSSWMVPPENFGEFALLIGTDPTENEVNVGIAVCYPERLGAANRDGKRPLRKVTVSTVGRWLVHSDRLPRNFVATLDPGLREQIMSAGGGQARITALAHAVQNTPIPREALHTIAHGHKDVMRRVRSDRGDPLKGMVLLNGRLGRKTIQALGLPRIADDEFISVPRTELQRLNGLFEIP